MEAVIDKDLASSLLADQPNANLLLISTSVARVAIDFGRPEQRWLERLTRAEAEAYLAEGRFRRQLGAEDPRDRPLSSTGTAAAV